MSSLTPRSARTSQIVPSLQRCELHAQVPAVGHPLGGRLVRFPGGAEPAPAFLHSSPKGPREEPSRRSCRPS
jgi:hypothetical protein